MAESTVPDSGGTLLRTVFDHLPALVWVLSTEGVVLDLNRRAADALHTTAADVRGTRLWESSCWAWNPALQERCRQMCARAASGKAVRLDAELRFGAIDRVTAEARFTPLPDPSGRITHLIVSAEDVTMRAEALAAAHEREHLLRLFADRAPAAIAMFDMDMRYVAVSRRFIAAYGLHDETPASLLGRSHYDVFPEIPPLWREVHQRVLVGETLSASDDPFVRQDGRTDWIDWEMTPWYRTDGAIGGAILSAEVVTARTEAERALRRSEAQLRTLSEQLEERVHAEAAARQAAQTRSAEAERLQALGELAAGIAHDFNNVLQAILGATAIMRRYIRDIARMEDTSQIIEDAANRGASVTQRLLAFARRTDLRTEAIDVAAMLAEMSEVLGRIVGPGIDIKVDAPAELPAAVADRSQLATVLVNLATNARDAMPRGGNLRLTARAEEIAAPRPELALQPGCYVRIDVADSGQGMDAATAARATEPFFTTKPPGKGTGLGLSMARGFAEQSGGALSIASAPDHGATLTLWLPAAKEPTPVRPAQPATAPLSPEAHTILVVDDDEPVLEVVATQLQEVGYKVIQAADGGAALALIDAGEPVDLLISDLSMPGMDGAALIQAAKRRRPGLPAIMLTGFVEETQASGGQDMIPGPFALLRKPIRYSQLTERVAALLSAPRASPPDAARSGAGASARPG